MKDPLNRRNGPAILRLFDACFKQGVIDACGAGDDYSVREFISLHKKQWTFGTIADADTMDWRAYRFVLYRICRANGCTMFAEDYLLMIRKKNHLWCLLPFCMWFYLMGAEEWLAYPGEHQMAMFKMNKRVHWDPNLPVKKFTRMDYISSMHDAAFAYKKLDDENKPVPDSLMDSYCQAIYDLTREYVTSKR